MAIEALGKAVVSDSILQVRLKAIAALAKIRGEEAIPYLIKALDDSNFEVRVKASEAIGEICCPMSENPNNKNFNFYAQVGNINTSDVTVQGDQIGTQHN